VGLVTKRDTDFLEAREGVQVKDIMTAVADLVKAEDGIELVAANNILHTSKKGKLPILTKEGCIVALVARTDLKKNATSPVATKDKKSARGGCSHWHTTCR